MTDWIAGVGVRDELRLGRRYSANLDSGKHGFPQRNDITQHDQHTITGPDSLMDEEVGHLIRAVGQLRVAHEVLEST